MSLTIYAKNINGPAASFQVVCEAVAPKEDIDVFNSLQDLTHWLLKTHHKDAVVVLMAENGDELSELVPILPLFRKMKIILVLPDREPETIKIGYQLEPRFLSFLDSGFSALKEVVQNMLQRSATAKARHHNQ